MIYRVVSLYCTAPSQVQRYNANGALGNTSTHVYVDIYYATERNPVRTWIHVLQNCSWVLILPAPSLPAPSLHRPVVTTGTCTWTLPTHPWTVLLPLEVTTIHSTCLLVRLLGSYVNQCRNPMLDKLVIRLDSHINSRSDKISLSRGTFPRTWCIWLYTIVLTIQ